MIRIELTQDEGFQVTEGLDEFFQKIDKTGPVEVIGAHDGKLYYVHEIGDQVFVLSLQAQNALAKLAQLLIQDIVSKNMH